MTNCPVSHTGILVVLLSVGGRYHRFQNSLFQYMYRNFFMEVGWQAVFFGVLSLFLLT
jgi:hypothetical protein